MTSSNTVPYCKNGIRGRVLSGSYLEQWLHDGHDPSDLVNYNVLYVKTGKNTRAGFVDLKDCNGSTMHQLFVKEYRHKPYFRIIYGLAGRHRASKVWNISWKLLDHSIPIPRPFGYFVHGIGKYIGVSYYCCEALPESENLGVIARRESEEFGTMITRGFLENLGQDLAAFHELGAIHGDLKWSNILVDNNRERYWFTDLDAAHYRPGHSSSRLIACDIARFAVSGIEYGYSNEIENKFLASYANRIGSRFAEIESPMKSRVNKLLQRKQIG